MSSHSFGAFIQHESLAGNKVVRPAQVLQRDEITSIPPSAVELDELRWGERLNGPKDQVSDAPVSEDLTLPTPRELEQSLPPTPKQNRAVDALVQSATNPPRNRWRLASTGVMFLLIGINDAVVCPNNDKRLPSGLI
jgi:hypothetical protein